MRKYQKSSQRELYSLLWRPRLHIVNPLNGAAIFASTLIRDQIEGIELFFLELDSERKVREFKEEIFYQLAERFNDDALIPVAATLFGFDLAGMSLTQRKALQSKLRSHGIAIGGYFADRIDPQAVVFPEDGWSSWEFTGDPVEAALNLFKDLDIHPTARLVDRRLIDRAIQRFNAFSSHGRGYWGVIHQEIRTLLDQKMSGSDFAPPWVAHRLLESAMDYSYNGFEALVCDPTEVRADCTEPSVEQIAMFIAKSAVSRTKAVLIPEMFQFKAGEKHCISHGLIVPLGWWKSPNSLDWLPDVKNILGLPSTEIGAIKNHGSHISMTTLDRWFNPGGAKRMLEMIFRTLTPYWKLSSERES